MKSPLLYRQLLKQLGQWIVPKDRRHLQGFAEIVAAILQAESGCLSHWLPYLSHRGCQARSHMERLSYFVRNDRIGIQTFYASLLKHAFQAFEGEVLTLTLDTSMLWDQFCLIELCLAWGGRSLTVSQQVLEHGSATVGFDQYRPLSYEILLATPSLVRDGLQAQSKQNHEVQRRRIFRGSIRTDFVLEAALSLLPHGCTVTLLADRGFEQGALIRWLRQHGWPWAIRAKSDLRITLAPAKAPKPRGKAPGWPKDKHRRPTLLYPIVKKTSL